MWKRFRVLIKAAKDFFVDMFNNAVNHIKSAVKKLGWKLIIIIPISIYVLYMLPQLGVFAVIASFTSGIQDPIIKFIAGIIVFTGLEFLLLTVAWTVICILGIPEMLRFATYITNSYEKRLAEEELREEVGEDISIKLVYQRLKDH